MNADKIKAALKAKADANGDGKVDKNDIELVVNRLTGGLDDRLHKSDDPWKIVATVSFGVSIFTFFMTKLLFC